jgi:hypothetical protein
MSVNLEQLIYQAFAEGFKRGADTYQDSGEELGCNYAKTASCDDTNFAWAASTTKRDLETNEEIKTAILILK